MKDSSQKNHGFNLHHKYVRKNFTGIRNFYMCMQIAHLIDQLFVLCHARMENLEGNVETIVGDHIFSASGTNNVKNFTDTKLKPVKSNSTYGYFAWNNFK